MENKRNLDHLLTTLLEVVDEKSVFIKTQQPRLHTLWDNFWDNSPLEIPQIRNIPLNKRKFISNLEYRAKILDNLSEAMKDGYNVVKTVVNFILLDYIQKGKFKDDFPQSSPDMVKYKIIDDMLGSLLQFVVLDNIPIPLDYIIVAKFKSLMN